MEVLEKYPRKERNNPKMRTMLFQMKRKKTFFCSGCKKDYFKAWSDEEAKTENIEMWGKGQLTDKLLCDDCWKEFLKIPKVSERIRN